MPHPHPTRAEAAQQPVRPAPNAPFHPNADQATYRDLLLFEERLKMNAEMLRRRRRRYNAFLWTFIGLLVIMGYRLVFLPPRTWLLFRALQAAVAVVFITLALFFASGMYEEKIRYAHSYVNHSNKALRPLNMYLNLRRPRSSLLSFIPFFSHSPPTSPIVSSSTTTTSTANLHPNPNANSTPGYTTSPPTKPGKKPTTVMATIPPSSNPRGELIFSSRVDRSFREGYERYRANFERRREERMRLEKAGRAWPWPLPWGEKARMDAGLGLRGTPTPPLSRRSTPELGVIPGGTGNGNGRRSPSPGLPSSKLKEGGVG